MGTALPALILETSNDNCGNCGTRAWVTDLIGLPFVDEDSQLTSPCFDASALTADPILSFSHLSSSTTVPPITPMVGSVWTASSGTWALLGNCGSGTHWYDDDVRYRIGM